MGAEKIEEFETVEHKRKMLSLDKSYNYEDLRDFDEKIRLKIGEKKIEYVVEPKIDGLGVALHFENKIFKRGATRGDGSKGEDITPNLKTIKSIPLKLTVDTFLNNVEFRGEVYIPKDAFREMNKKRIKEVKEPFANPRNAAAGTVRNKDPKRVAQRPLDIFIYSISNYEDDKFKTHWEKLNEIKKAGLRINDKVIRKDGIEEVMKYIERFRNQIEDLNYEIDGIVIKVNNLKVHEILGTTKHHPKWAMAYKYPPKRKTTKIKNIEIMVGRTGKLTPVAILEPIKFSGTQVSRASLHNEEEIRQKDIRIGDTVLVEKAGEIIPQVIKAIKKKRDGSENKFEMPQRCPICGSAAKMIGSKVIRRYMNSQCPAQIKQRIEHWGSRNAMNIEGLGPQLLNKLVDKGVVKNIADIYDLKVEELRKVERMGKKLSINLLEAINNSKERALWRLIFGLGIPFVGEYIAQILTEHYSNIEELMNVFPEELEKIDGIGPKIAKSVVNFFNEDKNSELIRQLSQHGINMIAEKEEFNNFLEGKKFVFTGALDKYIRDEASKEVRKYGRRVTSNVSRETDYLVVGKNPGSKFDKAKEENTIVLEEKDFLNMIINKKLPD